MLVTAMLSIYFFRFTEATFSKFRFHLQTARRLLKDSLPLLWGGIAVTIYMRIDQLMIGQMVGDSSLGQYAVAVRLSELWNFLPGIISSSVYPLIIQARERNDKQAFEQYMQTFYDLMAGLSYAIIVPSFFFARPLTILFFGEAYAEAGEILTIHIISLMFVALGLARSRWIVAEGLNYVIMLTSVIGGGINIALNYLLIPHYFGMGAAWATIISYMSAAYLLNIFIPDLWINLKQMTLALLLPFRLRSAFYKARSLFNF